MVGQEFFHAVRTGAIKLNGTELRVWAALMDEATMGNMVTATQRDMARVSGIKEAHFSRAMRALVAKDFYVRSTEPGKHNHLMLNPSNYWKGKLDRKDAGVKKYQKWKGL